VSEDLSDVAICREEIEALAPDGIVAVDNSTGQIVGVNFLSLKESPAPWVRAIGPLAVLPKAQRSSGHLGRELMARIILLARQQGAESIRLCVNCHNAAAVGLYSQLEFETKESLAILQPAPPSPASIPRDTSPYDQEFECKFMEEKDLIECIALMKSTSGPTWLRPETLYVCTSLTS